MIKITQSEVIKAAKMLKPKLCMGIDELPMKFIKDLALLVPDMLSYYFTMICEKGMPDSWKVAVVTPLFKSGDKSAISQYRPISNLGSLSKLFEKIILNRINDLGFLEGEFQHGFRSHRSTTTAMLELQDFVATHLDQGRMVGTYLLDLSAAFDLLRPEILHRDLMGVIPTDLLNIIMDFLSGRSF